jgi:branched-chain amino acid transport system substrate-binding protein
MRKRVFVKLGGTLAMVLGVLFALPPAGPAADMKTIKVASIMPFSGAYGFYGKILEPGIQIYADLVNKDGGVKVGNERYKIEMVFIDDAADPKRAAQAANQLVEAGCIADVGNFSLANPLASVLTPQKKIFVGLAERGYDASVNKYSVITPSWYDPGQHKYEAASQLWPEAKKWGALWYDWHKIGLDQSIKEMKETQWFQKAGMSHADPVYVPMGQMDFTTELAKLKEQGVQIVTSGFGPADYAMVIKQAHQLGYKFKWYNPGTGGEVDEFLGIAGVDAVQVGVAHGWHAPYAARKSNVLPELKDMSVRILQEYARRNGKPMTYMGGFEYGITDLRILIDLIEQAGSLDPDKIMEKARGGTIRDFEGTWKLGGASFYKAPVVKSSSCMTGVYKGREVVWGAENPFETLP